MKHCKNCGKVKPPKPGRPISYCADCLQHKAYAEGRVCQGPGCEKVLFDFAKAGTRKRQEQFCGRRCVAKAQKGKTKLREKGCTFETAQRIVNLLHNDIEARIRFYELVRHHKTQRDFNKNVAIAREERTKLLYA